MEVICNDTVSAMKTGLAGRAGSAIWLLRWPDVRWLHSHEMPAGHAGPNRDHCGAVGIFHAAVGFNAYISSCSLYGTYSMCVH